MIKNRTILIGLLVATLVLPVLLSDVQPVSAAYYGSVDFTGRVTINKDIRRRYKRCNGETLRRRSY